MTNSNSYPILILNITQVSGSFRDWWLLIETETVCKKFHISSTPYNIRLMRYTGFSVILLELVSSTTFLHVLLGDTSQQMDEVYF